jgi:hypothetical protein
MAAAARVLRAIHELEQQQDLGSMTYRMRRAVDGELAQLRWLLSSYPESARSSRGGLSRPHEC